MLNKIIRDFIKSGYFDTLKDISYDRAHKVSLFDGNKRYINFDEKVVKNLFKSKELKGCDLLARKDKKIYLIEFKNSTRMHLNKNSKSELKQKASESWMILLKLLRDYGISLDKFFENYRVILIVIYKATDSSKDKIHEHVEKKGHTHFGLERYERFYDEIITVDKISYLKEYNDFGWQ